MSAVSRASPSRGLTVGKYTLCKIEERLPILKEMDSRKAIPGLLALVAVLPGCGKGGAVESVAQAITDSPNCLSSRDRLWSALYREVDERGELPAAADVSDQIHGLVSDAGQAESLASAYATISREVRFLDREEALRRLAQMELGDRTSDEKIARQDELERSLTKALAASVAALGTCTTPPTTPPATGPVDAVPMFEAWRKSATATLYGAYKTMSVGYQSCNAVGLPALTSATPAVQGISVTGTHENGVGHTREVTDAAALFATNPFYAKRISPPTGCFGATKSPIIYDYGGKPYASSTAIDLTKNGGSGTSSLGVDCSGFIATAVLAGGLRLKQGVSSKPAQSGGVSASMLADPANNGLSCFARLPSTKTQNLQSGDVIANTGHVVMVDRAGTDPLGIEGAKTSADCENVSYKKFDFTIIQSSASKGGIGMNRYRAVDYLAGYSAMRIGLEAYARSFCRVRIGLDSPSTLAKTANAVVIRNKGGSACTDNRVPLVGETCLQACGTGSASVLADSDR